MPPAFLNPVAQKCDALFHSEDEKVLAPPESALPGLRLQGSIKSASIFIDVGEVTE
jgi:hypothetical protein